MTKISDPHLDDGLRSVQFFNGRLLSAEDLGTDQEARRVADARLGQLIGAGVGWGLDVARLDASLLRVRAGQAINRLGQVLALPADLTLDLNPELAPVPTGPRTGFDECSDVSGSLPGVMAQGLFVLCLGPAQGRSGQAPSSGLTGGLQVASTCTARYRIDGVRFRLVRLAAFDADPGPPQTLRNRAAWRCSGQPDAPLEAFLGSPFGSPVAGYGLLDSLLDGPDAETSLRRCDVPLTLLLWERGSGLGFVDGWAARRRPHSQVTTRWSALTGERRRAEAEARFQQFGDHLLDLQRAGLATPNVRADQYFEFLPPVGLLPLGSTGFQVETFFSGGARPPALEYLPLDPQALPLLIEERALGAPIRTGSWPASLRIYRAGPQAPYALFMQGDGPSVVTPPTAGSGRVLLTLLDETGRAMDASRVQRVWAALPDGRQLGAERVQVPASGEIYVQNRCRPVRQLHGEGELFQLLRFQRSAAERRVSAIPVLSRPAPEAFSQDRALDPFQKAVPGYPNEWAYVIDSLPAGPVVLRADVSGYAAVSETTSLTEREEQRLTVCCRPRAVADPPLGGVQFYPGRAWIDAQGRHFGKVLVPEQVTPVRPPSWGDPQPVPPEWKQALEGVLEEYLGTHPDAAFSPRDPRLLIDPGYQPGQVSDGPYAYVVSEDGQALPVLLTPADRTLPGTVSLAQSGVPELINERRLDGTVLAQLDVFSAAWSGLLGSVLDVGTDSARSLIGDTRAATTQAQTARSYLTGIDGPAAARLAQAGLQDDVALANASPDAVQAALGQGYSAGYALRLVGQARSAVQQSAWSLGAAQLDLSAGQLRAAQHAGVDSLGELKRRLEVNDTREALLGQLALGELSAGTLQQAASAQLQLTQLRARPALALADLSGIDAGLATRLVGQGVSSVAALADSEPARIGTLLNLPLHDAETLVRRATLQSLQDLANLSPQAAETLLTDSGHTQLSLVAGQVQANQPGLSQREASDVAVLGALNLGGLNLGRSGRLP